jgi:hypothetical protein
MPSYFTLSEIIVEDETVLSVYFGFVNRQLTVSELKRLNYKLTSGIFQLNDVKVSKRKTNPYEIMATLNATQPIIKWGDLLQKDMLFL